MRIPEVTIAAIYNRTEARARELMAQYGVTRYYADWREMIDVEGPDFVDIITPPETHAAICAYAAARGVHVICQKPLAPTFDESRRIVADVDSAGVRFMVHENFRWQPWYRAIKRVQAEETIGAFTHLHFMMRMGDGWGGDESTSRAGSPSGFSRIRPSVSIVRWPRVAATRSWPNGYRGDSASTSL